MDINKQAELADYAKQFEGVTIHGNRIRISFYYRGVRCLEGIRGMMVTKSNIKFAANKRTVILHEIATGTFDYASHFPESKKAKLWSGPARVIPTIDKALDNWLELKRQETAHMTYTSYKSKADNHIRPKFGTRKLDGITQSEIKRWISLDLAHLSNKTINEVLIPFRGVYAEACQDQLIDHNPLEFIDNLTVISDEPDPFTREEMARIAETPTTRLQEVNAFVFNCWTGLRPSELIALAWEDIDLTKMRLKVVRANVKGRLKATKTKGSTRTIDLLEPAIAVLKAQMEHSYMLGAHDIEVVQADNKTIKKEKVRFVFVNSQSLSPIANEGVYRDRFFSTHLKKAKVRYRGPGQARHTFASQLLTAGVNERWIAGQMGHTSIKMIEKHYGKWMKEEVPDMAARVSAALGFVENGSSGDPKAKGFQPK